MASDRKREMNHLVQSGSHSRTGRILRSFAVWVASVNRTNLFVLCVCMCVFYKIYKSSTLRGFVFGVVLCVELLEQHNTVNVFPLYLLGRVVFILVYGSRYAYMVACIHIWQHICIYASMYTNMLAYMHSSEPTGRAK